MELFRMCRWICRTIFYSSFFKGIFFGFLLIFFFKHVKFPQDSRISAVQRREASKFVSKTPNNNNNNKSIKGLEKIWSEIPSGYLNASHVTDWLEVRGSQRSIFVYSAYYDARKSTPVIRLVVILKKRTKVKECEIWTSSGKPHRVKAYTKTIRENWALKYAAAFVICSDLPDLKDDPIATVAIVFPGSNILEPKFDVIYSEKVYSKDSISVCVKPFHYEYNRAVWLVEFIEMHRLLGVNKFYFYNHTVGADLEKVLRYYMKKDVATVLPWSLPVTSQKEIRTEGIFAALNDCNLRNVGKFHYSIMIDLDEYIIPRQHNNYIELLHSLGDHGAYIFQNVFYYLYWDNDTLASSELYGTNSSQGYKYYQSEENGPYLLTAYKTTRLSKPHKHAQRSKYILQPEHAIECGNHVVWDFAGSKKGLKVPAKSALSHHYRICEFGGFDCLKGAHEIDRTAHKWLHSLFERVAVSCSKMFPDEGSCPKAPELGSPW